VIDVVEPVFDRALLETGRMVGFPPPAGGRRSVGDAAPHASGTEPAVGRSAPSTADEEEEFFLI
jgi:hypothetical protein